MTASLIGHSGSSAFQTIHHYSVDVAHGLALLFGIGTRGPSIMGFEDEVEQSFGRPCRQTNGRSKRTCELTSSIVPRGTSFHRSVELECPSIGLDAARFFMLLLSGGLAVRRTVGPSGHANSPHPSSREGHHSTARWGSIFLLLDLILHGFHAAAAACSRVQRNSVPSTHMRCMITANRRARATIAFFIPRRLAICIAQALSQDHFFDRSML